MAINITFGLDVSHHQPLLDWNRARAEGVRFAFLKATEGSSFVDSDFAENLRRVRAAGIMVAAYHYVRSTASVASQVANVSRVVPKDVPVIPDVETGSGSLQLTRDFIAGLQAAGYRVPLMYLPRWYWQQIGSPSLTGLPTLWSSRYPDNIQGSLDSEYSQVPASYWSGYGGLGVTVLQFTSSAKVAGYGPLDANAYIGTRDQLAAVIYGTKEEDVSLTAAEHETLKADSYRLKALQDMQEVIPNGPDNPVVGEEVPLVKFLNQVAKDVTVLSDAVSQLKLGGVDANALADLLGPLVAKAVNDELARRQAE